MARADRAVVRRSDNGKLLTIETPLGCVRIQLGLTGGDHQPVEVVSVTPRQEKGELQSTVDVRATGLDIYRGGGLNIRLVQETEAEAQARLQAEDRHNRMLALQTRQVGQVIATRNDRRRLGQPDLTEAEAEQIREAFYAKHPELREWIEERRAAPIQPDLAFERPTGDPPTVEEILNEPDPDGQGWA